MKGVFVRSCWRRKNTNLGKKYFFDLSDPLPPEATNHPALPLERGIADGFAD